MSCSLHDLAKYEEQGVPSVLVASEEFVTAAGAQGAALGTHPAVIFVAHPIQSRTDPEMAELADRHLEEVLAALIET